METEETSQEFDPFQQDKPKSSGGGSLLAVLALLVALAVAGFTGWQWWQARSAAEQSQNDGAQWADIAVRQDRIEQRFQQQDLRLESVEQLDMAAGLAELNAAIEQSRSVSGSDRKRVETMEEALQASEQRVASLENSLAALVLRDESPRRGLELAEVEYLLRSANERLQLYSDQRSAAQAFSLADAQLAALDDPLYLPVRQAISAAQAQLSSIQRADVIGLTGALGRLQSRAGLLPFPGQEEPEAMVANDAEESTGIWSRFTSALSDLVTVRRRVPDESLVSIEDKEYLRQGYWLQLETARLALMRQDQAMYEAALRRAGDTLDNYFDSDSAAVAEARREVERLIDVPLSATLPDVSEPWSTLQRLRTVRDSGGVEQSTEALVPTGAMEPPSGSDGPAVEALEEPLIDPDAEVNSGPETESADETSADPEALSAEPDEQDGGTADGDQAG